MLKNILSTLSMIALAIILAFGQAKAGNDEVHIAFPSTVDESAYIDKIFTVHVDGTSIEELCAQYACANPDAALLFKADKSHDCKIVLKPFPEGMTTEEITAELAKEDLQHASPSETLSFVLANPEFHQMKIIALGQTAKINGYQHAILTSHGCVQVSRSGCKWNANVFAATPISK